MNPYRTTQETPAKITPLLTALFFASALAVPASVIVVGEGCSATSSQVQQTFTDGWKLGTCVVGLITSGVTDISLLLQCSGATEQLVIDIINDWEARNPDAGSSQKALMEQAKTNAAVSLAKKAPGK